MTGDSLLGARVLKWLRLVFGRREPPATLAEPSDRYITVREFEARISEELERFDWKRDEWHEKFSTLHARLAKRVKQQEEQQEPAQQSGQPSDLELWNRVRQARGRM